MLQRVITADDYASCSFIAHLAGRCGCCGVTYKTLWCVPVYSGHKQCLIFTHLTSGMVYPTDLCSGMIRWGGKAAPCSTGRETRRYEWVVELSRSTYNMSFRRRVFPGNHLHWYWQLKTNRRKYTKTQTDWPYVSKTHNLNTENP